MPQVPQLLFLFVAKYPTHKENTDGDNYDSDHDTHWGPHFFNQIEYGSHIQPTMNRIIG
ncbi:protein of unknown function [Candidatus Methylocalor cossyra]|uniref:Uncharacterized protein n=1 Tax=Candidatus Methylocalor cossyra TaxID=3108543 RepID=A0ABM9NE09_9GAMM